MQSSVDKSQLIIAAQAGDTVALGCLLREYQPLIRRYAYRHCAMNDVDDAVQESLIVITKKITSLQAIAAFSSWLFVLIKRQCLRLARVSMRFEHTIDQDMEAMFATQTDQDLQRDLSKALAALPPHYLDVILLRDFEELSISEIAHRLGQSDMAIKSRLHRARTLVRNFLSEDFRSA